MVISNVPLLEDGAPGKNKQGFFKKQFLSSYSVYPLKELLERNKQYAK